MSSDYDDSDNDDTTTIARAAAPAAAVGASINFRDVGVSVRTLLTAAQANNNIDPSVLAAATPTSPNVLFRGGATEGISWEALGKPKTVINLRAEPSAAFILQQARIATGAEQQAAVEEMKRLPRDSVDLHGTHGVKIFNLPTEDKVERYDSTDPEVRVWIAAVLKILETCELPVYIGCRSGRDRTGVVVGAILMALNVPPQIIVEEYKLSSEISSEKSALFRGTLSGFVQQSAKPAPKQNPKHQHQQQQKQVQISPQEAMSKYLRGAVNLDRLVQRLTS